jgi:hypothetical protein
VHASKKTRIVKDLVNETSFLRISHTFGEKPGKLRIPAKNSFVYSKSWKKLLAHQNSH